MKDLNQERVVPEMPKEVCNLLRRKLLSMVSNAVLRSRETRSVDES